MTKSLFLQIEGDDKEHKLAQTLGSLRDGRFSPEAYFLEASELSKIPLAPFAYSVGNGVRTLFCELPPLEGDRATVKQGLATAEDFRFIRTAWETPAKSSSAPGCTWFPFAKGGNYSPFYADVFLKVNWEKDGSEIRHLGDPTGAKPLSRPQNIDYYCRPGLTWPLRTQSGLAIRVVPKGCVFGHKGPCMFAVDDNTQSLLCLLGITCSSAFRGLVEIQMAFGSYEVGVLQRTVVPEHLDPQLADLALMAWRAKRNVDTSILTSHAFFRPALAQPGSTLACGIAARSSGLAESVATVAAAQAEIDLIACRLYGLEHNDRQSLEATLARGGESAEGNAQTTRKDTEEDEASSATIYAHGLVSELLDYALGCAFGRWDIRCATGERQTPELPDPFDPLPACPPGMLQGDDGLPLLKEEGMRMKDDGRYPLRVAWDGFLIDDQNHPEDTIGRVREALGVIWADQKEGIEAEACQLLGVRTIREYFRKSFFTDHLKRHSKSRRQAPIYWPLSTTSGSYTLWIYYHRLTPDTLFKCIQQFLEPKIKEVEQTIHRLRTMISADEGGTKERKQLEEAELLLNELKEMHAELSLRAPKWKPNLNDGVLITACPLWKMFRLPKWRKDLEACWKKLEAGDYDWAHLAYTLFPDRVREKCKSDRSLAIAHGLEDLCQVQAPAPKKTRGKKTKKPAAEEALL
jgi:hypothetical protein